MFGVFRQLFRDRGRLGREVARLHKIMEKLMPDFKDLVARVEAAETKIDGQALIIGAHADVITDLRARLAAIVGAPTSEQVQSVIDGLDTHLSGLNSAVDKLVATDQAPPADAPPAS